MRSDLSKPLLRFGRGLVACMEPTLPKPTSYEGGGNDEGAEREPKSYFWGRMGSSVNEKPPSETSNLSCERRNAFRS